MRTRKIRRYNQDQVNALLEAIPELKEQAAELRPLVGTEDLNHSFEYGNFFSLYSSERNVIDPERVVIQWIADNEVMDESFNHFEHEVIADSIEEALIIMADIEIAKGKIRNVGNKGMAF